MKKFTSPFVTVVTVLLLITIELRGQCSFTGLAPEYCRNAAAVGLTANIAGGNFYGPGIVGSAFYPNLAGAGTHTITYGICTNSYQVSSGTYSFLTVGGTNVSLSDDQVSGSLPLGFSFEFFCTTYTNFAISSNGFITFNVPSTDNGCCDGQNIPSSTTPNNLIAFAWEDLNPSTGGTITYTTIGSQPNRIMVMTFSNVPHYNGGGNVTAQVQLYEGSNRIEIHTMDMQTNSDPHTMGIENSGGSAAFTPPGRNASGSWSASNDMYQFIPINNCVTSQTTTVDGTSLTVAGDNTVCLHSSITLTASGTTTYSWNVGGSSSVMTDSPVMTTTYIVTGLAPGTLGCVYSTPHKVTVLSTPVSASSSNQLLCVGSTATLTASGASTYTWSQGPNTTITTVNPVTTTSYTLWGTSTAGCTDQYVITQNVNTNTLTMPADTAICIGDQVSRAAQGASTFTWNWNGGSSPFQSILISPSLNTTYSLSATDQFGCLHQGVTSVSVNPLPNVTVTTPKTKVCRGERVIFTAAGANTYSWNSPVSGSSNTGSVIPTVDLPLTVSVTGTDSNGCKDGATQTIQVDKCVGLEEFSAATLVEVYPNPSTGVYIIKLKEGTTKINAEIYNVTGALIYSKVFDQSVSSFDISNEASGLYFLNLYQEGRGIQIVRLVKD